MNAAEDPRRARGREALAAALEQLRRKLLDLTGRNRLLNFKPTLGKSLQSVEGCPQAIYDRLVEGVGRGTILVRGVPEPPRDAWELRDGRTVRPDVAAWAALQGIPTLYDLKANGEEPSFRALLYPEDLAKHCRKIEREANLAIEETGANMLFLVLGFLQFPDQEQSDRHFLAPLISIPVALKRIRNDSDRTFEIEYTGDDIAANLSLAEKLRVDHGLELPKFNEDSPGIEEYFKNIRRAVESRPGFEVKPRATLCLLSFTNMLLVRDLDPDSWPTMDGQHALLEHPVVKSIFEGASEETNGGEVPDHDVDDGPGAAIPLVFAADSSQHRALVDVLHEHKNLVIEGPPGTGKSQTITNLIAACIREGKTVLFVAEKLAALEVVKSRLVTAGLDPFVLELHSSKTNKKRVLEEIGRRVAHRATGATDLPHKLERLEAYRKKLQRYVKLLKSITGNSLGLTVHALIWRAEVLRMRFASDYILGNPISVDKADQINTTVLSDCTEILQHLADQYVAIGRFDDSGPFWGFYPEELLPGDEHTIRGILVNARTGLATFKADAEAFAAVSEATGLSAEEIHRQFECLESLRRSAPTNAPLQLLPRLFSADSTALRVKGLVERLSARVERYEQLQGAVQQVLTNESDASEEYARRLRHLTVLLQSVGLVATPIQALLTLGARIKAAADGLGNSLSAIRSFCERNNLSFLGPRGDLQRLRQLTALVKTLPEKSWTQFNARLCEDGATAALEALETTRQNYQELQRRLEPRFYLDAIPDTGALREAILTLREGPAWYRAFQSRWRNARALHRSLLKSKTKYAPGAQLDDLESLQKYVDLGRDWCADPALTTFCRLSSPAEPVDLSAHLAVSRWYDEFRQMLGELQAQPAEVPKLERPQLGVFLRDFAHLETAVTRASAELDTLDSLMPVTTPLSQESSVLTAYSHGTEVATELGKNLEFLRRSCASNATVAACASACEGAVERGKIAAELEANAGLHLLFGDQYRGVNTDVAALMRVIEWGQRLYGSPLPAPIRRLVLGPKGLHRSAEILATMKGLIKGFEEVETLERELQNFGACDLNAFCGMSARNDVVDFSYRLGKRIEAAVAGMSSLIEWSKYVTRRGEAIGAGLREFVNLLEGSLVSPVELPAVYGYSVLNSILRGIFRDPVLGSFSSLKHDQIQADFRRFDTEIIGNRGTVIAEACLRSSSPPAGRMSPRVDEKTEMALLNHLLPQQKPRVPVRQILSRAPGSIKALKPCLMMGPHAVAQFLKPGGMSFDVVVMDEASQLSPEHAIGAIARGSQLVVVGDSKQLPPTNFFQRQNQLAEENEEFTTTDAESILDICSASFGRPRSLLWHYRSRHHSLIAFSNHAFYEGRLIICPSPFPEGARLGIRATYLAHAIYENQINPVEANRVVDAVVEHIETRPDESLGVVTLNIKQRDLIQELLEERLHSLGGADGYRAKWHERQQPLFVKNLENVQGDERDCVIISTTFGRPPGVSKPRQNFGPISRQGGWRRLNVLFTRARSSVSIFTSLQPEDIVDDATTPEGTKALKGYLEYARSGRLVSTSPTEHEPDSDFERAVIEVLRRMDYQVTPQLGVSGFRIDIAVKHPDFPGAYLAAIECDGAQYHSAQSARDRDRIRQEILESQGWRGRIWRIWSTDWFRAPTQEATKVKQFLDRLRQTWKPEFKAERSWVEEGKAPEAQPAASAAEETAKVRQIVDQRLFANDEEQEVRVGDCVTYLDTSQQEPKSVRITRRATALDQGLISEATPLAQVLLGAVVGDEVTLSVPGNPTRTLRILSVKRD